MSKTEPDSERFFDKTTLYAGSNGREHRPWNLVDMHCHLDRMANGAEVASELESMGIAAFCTTVTPADTLAAREQFAPRHNIRVGAGLHPWWVDEDPLMVEQAATLVAGDTFIGEIGLDFSPSHIGTRAAQLAAFERILDACGESPLAGRVVSIHAVRAASEALDVLERHNFPRLATCIFHWFSGTSEDFMRLRKLGCHISVNERMLATKRGREYARQMPLGRLHLETDAPAQPGSPYSAEELESSLNRTLNALARIRGIEQGELAAYMAQTSAAILGKNATKI